MAAIDKTYCKTWEEYQEVRDWCKGNEFTCPNGIKVKPIENLYSWSKEDFGGDKELPILNTSQTTDYFLIKYCPAKVVQDRMCEVYGKEYVEGIKNGNNEYDSFAYPEVGSKVKMTKDSNFHNRKPFPFYSTRKNRLVTVLTAEVEYQGETIWYNEDIGRFLLPYELGECTSSCAHLNQRSIKAIMRRIKKWKLPKGATVTVCGRYVGEDWKFKII